MKKKSFFINKFEINSAEDLQNYLKENDFNGYNHKDIIYKYVDIETAKKILKNGTLKFSKPDEFNDPFELGLDSMDFSLTKKEIKKLIEKLSNKNAENLSDSQIKDLEEELKAGFGRERDKIGISCFAKNNDNVLMWSHYADKHRGICLGFSISQEADFKIMIDVKYVEEKKIIKYANREKIIIPNWVFTKSDIWRYEAEIRALCMNKNGFFPFNSSWLTEVYYGINTDSEDIKKIEECLKNYRIEKKFKMEANPKNFSLIAKEY